MSFCEAVQWPLGSLNGFMIGSMSTQEYLKHFLEGQNSEKWKILWFFMDFYLNSSGEKNMNSLIKLSWVTWFPFSGFEEDILEDVRFDNYFKLSILCD